MKGVINDHLAWSILRWFTSVLLPTTGHVWEASPPPEPPSSPVSWSCPLAWAGACSGTLQKHNETGTRQGLRDWTPLLLSSWENKTSQHQLQEATFEAKEASWENILEGILGAHRCKAGGIHFWTPQTYHHWEQFCFSAIFLSEYYL